MNEERGPNQAAAEALGQQPESSQPDDPPPEVTEAGKATEILPGQETQGDADKGGEG